VSASIPTASDESEPRGAGRDRARDRLPGSLLRIEGLALFAGALALYLDGGFSILALALLALAPDISLLGYLGGPRIGAIAYDLAHFEAWPILLATVAVLIDWSVGVQLGLIWLAHIGIDRTLGYGLKYRSAFSDTHLQRV
jgi:hypothetical protein